MSSLYPVCFSFQWPPWRGGFWGAQGSSVIPYIGKGQTPQRVQSHVPDAVKKFRTFTIKNILFMFIQNTAMYKNVHNIFIQFTFYKRNNWFQILSAYMSCKHCSGPMLFTKIASTLGDFHDCVGAFRLRARSAESISQAAHVATTGWIPDKMRSSRDIPALSQQCEVVDV